MAKERCPLCGGMPGSPKHLAHWDAEHPERARNLAAEARHGGRYITGALARAIDNDGIRARFAGEEGPDQLADIWRYTAPPSGAEYPGSGRDTTQRYAISAARIGGVDWEHSAYWKPQPLPEAVFDWPVYRAAMVAADDAPLPFYEDVRSSFVIAMENAGIEGEVIHSVAVTVDDYVDNHYGD